MPKKENFMTSYKHTSQFGENSQIILKISATPILLTFMYLVALNLLENNRHKPSFRQIIDSKEASKIM